jgi:hypothetical protein
MTVIAFPAQLPTGAAQMTKGTAMDLTLHIGAHRCATASFHHYLSQNADRFAPEIAVWGPDVTRTGLFSGVKPDASLGGHVPWQRDPAQRAAGRLHLNVAAARARGARHLILSDPALMGSVRENLRCASLYRGVGERIARIAQALGDRLTDIAIGIRCPDAYWRSVTAQAQSIGVKIAPQWADRVVSDPRSWRDVITDVACAAPQARLRVYPFEQFGARPETLLAAMTGLKNAPTAHARAQLNCTAADGGADGEDDAADGTRQEHTINPAQSAELRERYADDMIWLTAGADGLAGLAQDPNAYRALSGDPAQRMTRGRPNDQHQRRLAGAG